MKYKCEELYFTNGENRIYGVVYRPEADGKFPTAILSHGYNSSHRDIEDLAALLAENGIAAYCYDFCGGSSYSLSDGKSTDMSIKTEISDLKTVIDGICGCGFADSERIFLYGESQGGFVSALTAAEMPERIKALALLYPAFCIPDGWKDRCSPEDPETFMFMNMEISKKFARELPEYDVFEHMEKYGNPTAVYHGKNDTVVDISYSERLAEIMDNCTLTAYDNEGHGFSPVPRADMAKKAAEFLKSCI